MCDSDEDLPDDISALVMARKQLSQDENLGQGFLRAWCAFESIVVLFFSHIDVTYRAELKKPVVSNLDSNLQALRRATSCKRTPALFKEPLELLEQIDSLKKVGSVKWAGHNIYHDGSKHYFKIHDGFMLPVDQLMPMSQRCLSITKALEEEYKLFRDFEINLESLVLLLSQHPDKQSMSKAYATMCDVYAANLKINNKLVSFFGDQEVQFKVPNTHCRIYDLMGTCKQQVAETVSDLKEPIQHMIQRLREQKH